MAIIIKILLGITFLFSIFFGRFILKEFFLFRKDLEIKNTSLMGRILVNGIIFILFTFLMLLFGFSIYAIFSKITVETPF